MSENVGWQEAPGVIISALTRLRSKRGAAPVRVAIVGGSGSGKGTLIAEISKLLADVSVLSLDDYYIGKARMSKLGVTSHDDPRALDLAAAAKRLATLKTGAVKRVPNYDFAAGERSGTKDFRPGAYVFVDGLFALHSEEIRDQIDYAVFLESDPDSDMLRRLFRDAGPSGRTKQSSRQVLEQFFREVLPAKRGFIDPSAAHADLIVESRYVARQEAYRAGPMQFQLKVRGRRTDEEISHLVGAVRIGATVGQVDRFMRPKGRDAAGEMLRLRLENDVILMTYKGPFLPSSDGVGARQVTAPIELPGGAMRWFTDDYENVATIKKARTVFHADGVLLSRDCVSMLGEYMEARTEDAARASKLRAMLSLLGPGAPMISESYLDIWRANFRHGSFSL